MHFIRAASQSDLSVKRNSFLNLLKNKVQVSSLTEQTKEKYWTIYGEGSIGAKAEELLKCEWAIHMAGFEPGPRAVLAMGFFDDFLGRCGLSFDAKIESADACKKINETPFSDSEEKIFVEILKNFGKTPIAVRSSAHKDSSGTGVYESVFHPPVEDEEKNIQFFIRDIKRVLKSHFSPGAIAYRNKLGIQCGIAVLIEPVFGRYVKDSCGGLPLFGPDYGGIAFTSYGKSKRARLSLSSGLPTKAVKGESFLVFECDERNMSKIIRDILDASTSIDEMYALTSITQKGDLIHPYYDMDYSHYLLSENPNEWYFHKTNLAGVFEKIRMLKSYLGKDKYLEIALIYEDNSFRTKVLQISDFSLPQNHIEVVKSENTLLSATRVFGREGHQKGRYLVSVRTEDDLRALGQFNNAYKDYCVFIPDRLISQNQWVGYESISNSLVVVEYSASDYGFCHTGKVESHISGFLSEMKITYLLTFDITPLKIGNIFSKPQIFTYDDCHCTANLQYVDLPFEAYSNLSDQMAVLNLLPDLGKKE